ncbi:hypothetical protein K505DRAFT_387729 [Melanomma pulvis-pyrius CBS 109.77]|uniref:NAD(P)-binding domain-containing protein n=1 Tax=Melanomma pulvis-pyrius CBS 109.77 TaxID=1314802 RepID=A0A6A6XVP7_9PLEO|nr:hypothetical protein K505DRAFT_387729 [Melanomma pulvis-pyrius CBS 109.77]
MAESSSRLNILLVGPTGHGGSYISSELIKRGHHVVGLSRHPETVGTHKLYTPKKFDVVESGFLDLIEVFKGYDVIINPHSQGHAALTYEPFVEITRKIVRGARLAAPSYFIMIGGAGSLELPIVEPHLAAGESGHFWRAFRQAFADSESQVQYMEERLGPLGTGLRQLRNARQRWFAGTATEEDEIFMREYYETAFKGDYSQSFVKAARVTWMFFEGNTSWNWSYASPPALYRPCGGGENITIEYNLLPLTDKPRPQYYQGWYKDDPKDIEGQLQGISLLDFSTAVADDAETRFGLHKHWTAFTSLQDDTPYPSYVKIDQPILPREETV